VARALLPLKASLTAEPFCRIMLSMPAEIVVGEADDPYFIGLANRVVSGLLARDKPEKVWIIQIDNWFDHKWLKYSGYGLIASNIPMDRYDTVKAESFQEKVTFPPFTPNRVLGQWSYQKTGSDYKEFVSPRVPHGNRRRFSDTNLRNRVQDFSDSALFVWYSSNTVATGRGSVMIYKALDGSVDCWFVSFSRTPEWKLAATKGVSQHAIQTLLATAEV
jgi:hypothetical protein